MPRMSTAEAEKLPRAGQVQPHAQRTVKDIENRFLGAGHIELTEEEKSRGLLRPRWHSYQHVPCGTITDLRFDDAAEALAREPNRPIYRAKGLYCPTCQDLFPIHGNIHDRPGEYRWVDTKGHPTPIEVGT